MGPGDALDDEMRRHPRNPVQSLDPVMAERLLDGTVHEDDVPPEYRDVARVLASAAASPSPVPPAEAAALAIFRSTRRPVDPPRRTSVLSKMLGAKAVAAIVLGTAAVGTAAAAATGTLPDAAQAKAHSIVSAIPAGHGAAEASTHPSQAAGASGHATLSGVAGLCQAYASGSGGENGKKLDSTAFGRLADAAGGQGKITAYCETVTAGATHVAGSASTGDENAIAGACRSWQAADKAGRTPAAAVLERLTKAAGGADAIPTFCATIVDGTKGGASDAGRPSPATPSHPAPTPRGSAPTAHPTGPPTDDHGQGSPSHPAPPTPRD